MNWKRVLAGVLLGGAALVALAAWWYLPSLRAEVRLAPVTEDAVERFVVGGERIYRQGDPAWASEKIGGSGERLAAVGCTVCCLSMALAVHDIALNPSELNRQLKAADGYTYRGWVKWAAVESVAKEKVRIDLPGNPTHNVVNGALAKGDPVLVKVRLASGIQHWVLLVGREGNEYLMKDPLGDGKGLAPLSQIGSDILAVRIVRGS